jgi:hypothetical protein
MRRDEVVQYVTAQVAAQRAERREAASMSVKSDADFAHTQSGAPSSSASFSSPRARVRSSVHFASLCRLVGSPC